MDFRHKLSSSRVTQPGCIPPRTKCQGCTYALSDKDLAVSFIECGKWTHRECCGDEYGISPSAYIRSDSGCLQLFYVCSHCPQPREPRPHHEIRTYSRVGTLLNIFLEIRNEK